MPNLYATPAELKLVMPDAIRSTTSAYDVLLLRLADRISRFIDNHCRRTFYPRVAVRYFDGQGKRELAVPDLLEITTVSYSEDDGATYADLGVADYYATVEGDWNAVKSWTRLVINVNSSALSAWPSGQRSVRVAGVWGYADDREAAWEDSQDTVENNPLSAASTAISVNDADGADLWGVTPRFSAGQLLRIGSEICELTAADAGTNALTVVRGCNGSTAAEHPQNTPISIWRPPEPVKQSAIIQAVRQLERGLQGFGEARANPDVGQMFWIKSLDPEARMLLQMYVW